MSEYGDVAGAVRKARERLTIEQCRSLLGFPEARRRVVWHSPDDDDAPGIPCVVVAVGHVWVFVRETGEPPGPGHKTDPAHLTLAADR